MLKQKLDGIGASRSIDVQRARLRRCYKRRGRGSRAERCRPYSQPCSLVNASKCVIAWCTPSCVVAFIKLSRRLDRKDRRADLFGVGRSDSIVR